MLTNSIRFRFNKFYTLLLLVFLHKAITGVTDKVGNRTYWDWWKIVTKCKNINSNVWLYG